MQYCPHPHPSCGGHHQVTVPQPEAQVTHGTSFPSHAPMSDPAPRAADWPSYPRSCPLLPSPQPRRPHLSAVLCHRLPAGPATSHPDYSITVSPKCRTVHISPCLKYLNVACHPYEKEPQPHQVIEAQGCPLLAALLHRMSSLNLHTPAPQASL